MHPSSQKLGSYIRKMRRAANMSQAELAGDILSASYISLLEAGKRTPSVDVLRKLAERIKCDPEELIAMAGPTPVDIKDLEVELRYAEVALLNGDPPAALEAYRAVQSKVTVAAQPQIWYAAELGIARSLEHAGQLEEAVTHYEALHTEASDTGAATPRLTVATALCRCYRELGDLSHAIELAESALGELEELHLAPTVIGVELLSTLVGIYSERGDLHRASYLATQAIEQAQAVSDPKALGAAYWNASIVMHRNGRTADAIMLIEKALAIYAEGEDDRALARLRNAYAVVLLQSGQPEAYTAKELLEQSIDTLGDVGSSIDLAYCRTALARAEFMLGNAEAAVEQATAALDLLGPEHRLESARTQLVLAAARLAQGDRDAAQTAYERGALMLEASEANRQAAFAWAELAEIMEACGEEERALWAYRQSMRCVGHRENLFSTLRKDAHRG